MYGDRSLFKSRYRFALTATLFEGIAATASDRPIPLRGEPGLSKGHGPHAAEAHIPPTASYYRAKNPALRTRLVDYQMETTSVRVTARSRHL